MSRPEIFSELAFKQALGRAQREGKLLLVDATAEWCGPCKAMDRTTWRDPRVAAWLGERALAIQLDVDHDQVTARALGIQAMPTVILFRDGLEVDRVTGMRPADALLTWLDGALKGETELDRMRKQAASGDMGARYELAVTLARTGKLDEATEELAWLWEHVLEHEPAMVGVRLSYMANEMAQLAGTHPPAKRRFSALRDALQPALDGGDQARLADWIALNRILGEPEQTLAWFDRAGAAAVAGNPELARKLEEELMPLLVKARRWSDLGTLFIEPVDTVRRHRQAIADALGNAPPAQLAAQMAQVEESLKSNLRQRIAIMHASLLAAGRTDDARELREEAAMGPDGEATLKTVDELAERLSR